MKKGQNPNKEELGFPCANPTEEGDRICLMHYGAIAFLNNALKGGDRLFTVKEMTPLYLTLEGSGGHKSFRNVQAIAKPPSTAS